MKFGLFTDHGSFSVRTKRPVWLNVPAWVVTLEHVRVCPFGPPGADSTCHWGVGFVVIRDRNGNVISEFDQVRRESHRG